MAPPAELGARVRVCHSDGYWYYGTLATKDEKTGKFRVAFDDGDVVFAALPHCDIQVLGDGAHGTTVGDIPEQAAFHGSFKKRRAKQEVERYAPQEPQARSTSDTISRSIAEPKSCKAARVEENVGDKKRKRAAAEKSGRTNKRQRNERLTHDNSSMLLKQTLCEHQRRRSSCKECRGAAQV